MSGPVVWNEQLVGVLTVHAEAGKAFEPHHLATLQLVAAVVAEPLHALCRATPPPP